MVQGNAGERFHGAAIYAATDPHRLAVCLNSNFDFPFFGRDAAAGVA